MSRQEFSLDGTKLFEKADAGQQVTWWHQFMMNFEKGAKVSLLGFVAPPGTDLTNLNSAQVNVIYFGGSAKRAVDGAKDFFTLRDRYLKERSRLDNKPSYNEPSPAEPPQKIEANKPVLYDQFGRPINID